MNADFDFSSLYRELRVVPSASLADIKLAYRRRVAELHPDRIHDQAEAARAASQLQRLTRVYNDALQFQQRYGRLPGSPNPSAATRSTAGIGPSLPLAHIPRRRLSWLWLLSGIGLACAILTSIDPRVEEPDTNAIVQPSQSVQDIRLPTALRLGMSRDDVRAVQGAPYLEGGDRWEYGPSWLQFHHDLLVGWYSSPLNPLKVANPQPTDVDETDLRAKRRNSLDR